MYVLHRTAPQHVGVHIHTYITRPDVTACPPLSQIWGKGKGCVLAAVVGDPPHFTAWLCCVARAQIGGAWGDRKQARFLPTWSRPKSTSVLPLEKERAVKTIRPLSKLFHLVLRRSAADQTTVQYHPSPVSRSVKSPSLRVARLLPLSRTPDPSSFELGRCCEPLGELGRELRVPGPARIRRRGRGSDGGMGPGPIRDGVSQDRADPRAEPNTPPHPGSLGHSIT
ncbi:uncharacterized protein B0H64DRAFT_156757 [Chaetomium fimeti]|uniref:Uncharacterized protein n=1 Tax=Chaetomium fimeti TaxID=1854472 RepID=A0AAE0HG83_9PEZI|nr:hypothetical protein B0H64DRAFT_156757 [Chaetomium fimeti]